jgi:hypothetical protein
VRKRVSRLRKFLRDRWAAELMLAGLVVLLGAFGAIYWFAQHRDAGDVVRPEPLPVPSSPRALPPSRPAGDTQSGPDPLPAPSPAPAPSAVPTPSATVSAVPLPSALPKQKAPPPAKPTPVLPKDKTDSMLMPEQQQKFEGKATAKSKASSKAESNFEADFSDAKK